MLLGFFFVLKQFDIRDKVEKWVLPDYPLDSPLELPRTAVLQLIDELARRLETLAEVQ